MFKCSIDRSRIMDLGYSSVLAYCKANGFNSSAFNMLESRIKANGGVKFFHDGSKTGMLFNKLVEDGIIVVENKR